MVAIAKKQARSGIETNKFILYSAQLALLLSHKMYGLEKLTIHSYHTLIIN